MSAEKVIATVRSYTAAFLDANLLGKAPNSLLIRVPAEYPDVVLTTREQMLHARN
jgi:hypothetical protein